MFNPLTTVITAFSINLCTRRTEGLNVKGEIWNCRENQGKKAGIHFITFQISNSLNHIAQRGADWISAKYSQVLWCAGIKAGEIIPFIYFVISFKCASIIFLFAELMNQLNSLWIFLSKLFNVLKIQIQLWNVLFLSLLLIQFSRISFNFVMM